MFFFRTQLHSSWTRNNTLSCLFVLDIEDKSQEWGIFGNQLGNIVVVVSRSRYELFSGRADTPDS